MNIVRLISKDATIRTKRLFRNRNTLIWIVIIPIVIAGIVEALIPDTNDVGMIYIQDKDGDSTFADILVNKLSADYPVTLVDKTVDTAQFIEVTKTENPDTFIVVLVIPDNFDYQVLRYMSGMDFEARVNAGGLSFAADFIRAVDEDFDDGVVHLTVLSPDGGIPVSEGGLLAKGNDSISQYCFPSILISLTLLIVSGLTIAYLRDEKESGVSDSMRNSRYSPPIQAVSMIIWGLLPSAVVFVVTYVTICCFNPIVPGWEIIVGFILTSMVAVAFGMLMSELVGSTQSMTIANSAIIMVMLLISGGLIPIWMLPGWMEAIPNYVPMSYLVDSVRCCLGSSSELLKDTVVSIIFTITLITVWGLIRHYRRN